MGGNTHFLVDFFFARFFLAWSAKTANSRQTKSTISYLLFQIHRVGFASCRSFDSCLTLCTYGKYLTCTSRAKMSNLSKMKLQSLPMYYTDEGSVASCPGILRMAIFLNLNADWPWVRYVAVYRVGYCTSL